MAKRSDEWLFLEPFYGGSHRYLVDELADRLPFPVRLWTLPARKWKWRMRGAALQFSDRWRREQPAVSGIFCSSMLDVAALRGLLPSEARSLPLVVYFHENQLRYPVRIDDKRDFHYAWTNIQSALAADCLLWNSHYNLNSFLEELPAFLRRLPDGNFADCAERIRTKSQVLSVPLPIRELRERGTKAAARTGICRLLWNHRWEHDKGPERLFDALTRLAADGLEFELSLLGESYTERPPIFAEAERELGERIVHWGFIPEREDYLDALCRADFVLSTAEHEFQGLAVLEAAACGAIPLVPDDLAYTEIWPDDCRYRLGGFKTALGRRIREVGAWRGRDLGEECLRFDWERLLPRWRAQFAEFE